MKDNGGAQWDSKPLLEVAEVIYGTRVVKKRDQGTKYPVYGGGGATFSVDQTNRSDCTIVARFGMSEECVRFVAGDFFLNDSGLTVETRDQMHLSQEFLDVQLLGRQNEIYALGRGTAQKNLDVSAFKKLPIAIPSLEEQRRIVAVLGEAFEGLARAHAHAETNLQNTRDLLALSFEHELLKRKGASTQTTIGEVCTSFEYGTSTKSKPNGKMPVLRMGNLQSGEIDWTDLVYTDSESDIKKLTLKEGDVLFNRTNSLEHVGKAAIYRGDMPAIFAGYLIRVHYDSETLVPEFLNMFLNSKSARDYGRSISGKSVNQANISASKLKTYPIMLPSIDIQKEIVEKMESLREPLKDLERTYENKIKYLDDLRQSIFQKAFAGELT